MRGLVLLADDVGAIVAGPAIRAIALARVLREVGLEATIATLGRAEPVEAGIEVVGLDGGNARRLVDESAVVVVMGPIFGLMPWLAAHPVPIVADLYDPVHIEYAARASAQGIDPAPGVAELLHDVDAQLARADLVLCSNDRQRGLWVERLRALGRLGADDGADGLVVVAPFGIDAPPSPLGGAIRGRVPGIGDDEVILIWGGGVYDWFDPGTLIEAMALAAPRAPRLRLVFLSAAGAREATTLVGRVRHRAEQLGLGGIVHFNEVWVPYRDRAAWLGDADLGVTTHPDSEETRFSHRTRDLDYIWAGLPIVTSDGDVFADLVRTTGIGVVVPPADPAALADALVALAEDSDRRADLRERVGAIAPAFAWSVTLEPFADFAAGPARSASPAVTPPAGDPARSAGHGRALLAALRSGGIGEVRRRLRARRRRRGLAGA